MGERTFGKKSSRNRKVGVVHPRQRCLIVTGGLLTEPLYLNWLREKLKLNKSNVEIVETGFDARTVMNRAISQKQEDKKRAKQEKDSENVYSSVWVVVDVDNSSNVIKELFQIAENQDVNLTHSNPCFEVWLNFHLPVTTAHMSISDAQSLAKRKGLVDPTDSKRPNFSQLEGKTKFAKDQSKRLRKHHESSGTMFPGDSPSTMMDMLVAELQNMSQQIHGGDFLEP